MNFRSILSSSKLEIITSKRVMAFVYLALGSAILVWWIGALQQFFDAHLTYGQFDTTVTAFVLITLLLFCPLALTGALMLHAFILRERLLHWLKTRTVIADYTSGLSPAEAGTLVDFEYSLEETWATLLSLHFRNSITMRTTTHGIILSQGPFKMARAVRCISAGSRRSVLVFWQEGHCASQPDTSGATRRDQSRAGAATL